MLRAVDEVSPAHEYRKSGDGAVCSRARKAATQNAIKKKRKQDCQGYIYKIEGRIIVHKFYNSATCLQPSSCSINFAFKSGQEQHSTVTTTFSMT